MSRAKSLDARKEALLKRVATFDADEQAVLSSLLDVTETLGVRAVKRPEFHSAWLSDIAARLPWMLESVERKLARLAVQ